MTPQQFRMAKAALSLSNPDLARMTGLQRHINPQGDGAGRRTACPTRQPARGVWVAMDGRIARHDIRPATVRGAERSSGTASHTRAGCAVLFDRGTRQRGGPLLAQLAGRVSSWPTLAYPSRQSARRDIIRACAY